MGYCRGMLLETIILSACLSGSGCSQSMDAYYKSRPELGQALKKNERMVKNAIGEDTVKYTFPIVAALATREANVKISNNWSLRVGPEKGLVLLKWTY